jgi:predicted metal-dependent hydrolase
MSTLIKVKRLRASRSLRLRVYDDGRVVVTAPLKIAQHRVEEFIDQHRAWIEEKVGTATARHRALTQERESLFFRGKEFQFRLSVSPDKKPAAKFEDDTLLVTAGTEDHREVRELIEKLYRKFATKHFKQRVPLLSDLVGKDLSHVTIRSQRTRWGSCSSRNTISTDGRNTRVSTISLNWRLIMAPDWVSDYVIYHELAHLTHMNHSKAFWDLVAVYHKSYKEAEKWLKSHHHLLKF